MRFVRAVWKLLVGIKDALVLLFTLTSSACSTRRCPAGRRQLATACWRWTSMASSSSRPRGPTLLAAFAGAGNITHEFEVRDLVATLEPPRTTTGSRRSRRPRRIPLGGGQASPTALGEKMDEVKKSGKPVIAFATGYTDDRYQLASHASEIWMPSLGAMAVAGPGGNNLYFKGPDGQAWHHRQRLSRRHL